MYMYMCTYMYICSLAYFLIQANTSHDQSSIMFFLLVLVIISDMIVYVYLSDQPGTVSEESFITAVDDSELSALPAGMMSI